MKHIVLALVLCLSTSTLDYTWQVPQPEKLDYYIAQRYDRPLSLTQEITNTTKTLVNKDSFPRREHVLAVFAIESEFNPFARSPAGAKGLGQILYKKTKMDIVHNTQDTIYLLKLYYKKFGSEDAAIQAYNVGETNYRKGARNYKYLAKYKQHKKELQQFI